MRVVLPFAVWTLLGLFDACHSYVRYAYDGDDVGWWRCLGMGLSLWYAWAILAVAVFYLSRRFPFDPKMWPRWLAMHLMTGFFFALVKISMDYPIIMTFYCRQPGKVSFASFFGMAFIGRFHSYVLIYWAMLGVAHALNYHRAFRERELKAAQLETRLAHAQLQLLKMQLHPHFLFNTLNAISALIHRDAETAEHMLARLGDLLRLTLENAGAQEVVLNRELEFLGAYLEIEQVRFGPRLTVQMDIDPETRDACVPYLILQPLVENAIRHGIAPYTRAGHVVIRADRIEGRLRLQVRDNGPGLVNACPERLRTGVGLSNTRARLQQLYGEDHRFELNDLDGGLHVTIELPFSVQARADLPMQKPASAGQVVAEVA
jgi:hypothetical protein